MISWQAEGRIGRRRLGRFFFTVVFSILEKVDIRDIEPDIAIGSIPVVSVAKFWCMNPRIGGDADENRG